MLLGVGIASMAGEFRHGTSVPTFLITPRRRDVVVAKLVAVTGLGAVAGALSFGLALAVAAPALAHQGVHHLPGDTPQMWIGATLATALFGALGVALGSITRNVVVAIIGAIGWSYLVEGLILSQAVPGAGKWLPVGTNMAITRTGDGSGMLRPWVAADRAPGLGRCRPAPSPRGPSSAATSERCRRTDTTVGRARSRVRPSVERCPGGSVRSAGELADDEPQDQRVEHDLLLHIGREGAVLGERERAGGQQRGGDHHNDSLTTLAPVMPAPTP